MKLERCGYKESYRKPNLFYKLVELGHFYADMRGTDVIPIWDDPIPLLYFNFDEDIPLWKGVRIKEKEIAILTKNKCPYRFSYYDCEAEIEIVYDFEKTEKYFISFHYFYNEIFPDGFCKKCGKDIQKDSYHCSDECRDFELKRLLACRINDCESACQICKRKITRWAPEIMEILGIELPEKGIIHHTSYDPEKTMLICNSCHAKIHHSEDSKFSQYRPKDNRPQPKREFKLVECSSCFGNTRVQISENEGICYKCRKAGRT